MSPVHVNLRHFGRPPIAHSITVTTLTHTTVTTWNPWFEIRAPSSLRSLWGLINKIMMLIRMTLMTKKKKIIIRIIRLTTWKMPTVVATTMKTTRTLRTIPGGSDDALSRERFLLN